MNNFLQRNSSLIAWLGGLGIPFAVIVVGWLITSSIETSKLESEYVRMALGILTAHEKTADGKLLPLTDDEKVLRQWAIRLLNRKAPEKFTEEEQKALLTVGSPFGSLSTQDVITFGLGALFFEAFLHQSNNTEKMELPKKKGSE